MTIPVVVQMTVDSGTTYNLSADTNLQEIDLDNELEINVTQYTAPTYEGAYTVDAGLSAVTLETDGKVCTDDIVVNALTENTLTDIELSVNSSNGEITASVSLSPGYNAMGKAKINTISQSTQSARTITPTTSEQTAVASGKYTLGDVKVGAIPSQYADITGVTAQASDVLVGKYFVNSSGVLTLGTAIAGGGDGAPMPVDTVAEMIDTTKVYLYVGSETGYTFGNWYYYDGNDWVSGGKWGADGGVNTNARNLLQYILERVAYTDTDMEVYVNALYEALATYTIANALSHVTNSNTATGCEEGDSYTGTLTADTDYTIDTVTVTMGGVDITSTAYNNGVITIASVTGDIVITATATLPDIRFAVEYQGNFTTTSPSNTRVSLISKDMTLAYGETITFSAAEGYVFFLFDEYGAGNNSERIRAPKQSNQIYVYGINNATSYVYTSSDIVIGTSSAGKIKWSSTGWGTSKTGTIQNSAITSISFSGIGFYVEKGTLSTHGSDNITIEEAKRAVSWTVS